jgi:hypothetical protein
MKNLVKFIGFSLLWVACFGLAFLLIGCQPTPERTVQQTFTDSVKINPTCEIDTTAEPRIAMRLASIPDFWDPNYRPNRVIRLYIEADTLFRALYKDSAEQAIRSRIALINRVCEPRYGIRMEIVSILIRTRSDQTYRATAATPMLYAWATEYPTLDPTIFKLRLSGKNIGGSAYLSRGSVTSAKWAVLGMGFVPMGNTTTPGKLEYNILHEVCGHNCGLSHAFNCCAYLDRNGVQLGRLDSTWAGERTCTPSPLCRNTSRRHPSGWMGYGAFWNSQTWDLHPAIIAVLNQSLFYSTLPTFTPGTIPPPTPITTTWTFSGTTHSGTTSNVNDGNTDTRWVTTGRSTVTIAYSDSVRVNSVRVVSGFFSNNRWGSPIQPVRVLADGVVVFSATTSKPDTTVRIFRRVRSVVVEGNDQANNRWREVLIQ